MVKRPSSYPIPICLPRFPMELHGICLLLLPSDAVSICAVCSHTIQMVCASVDHIAAPSAAPWCWWQALRLLGSVLSCAPSFCTCDCPLPNPNMNHVHSNSTPLLRPGPLLKDKVHGHPWETSTVKKVICFNAKHIFPPTYTQPQHPSLYLG